MSITHSVTYIYNAGGSDQVKKTVDFTGDGEDNREIAVPNPSTNLLIAFVIDISQLKSIEIVADGALTLKTNDSGAPQETFVLVADKPIVWTNVCQLANPFADDVTKLYATNASGATVNLSIRMLVDATP